MKDLQHKYRTNQLSPEELQALRHEINTTSDELLETQMLDEWMCDTIDTSCIDDEWQDKLKIKIDKATHKSGYDFSSFLKIGRIAAAVLLPLFIVTTIYLYKENRQLGSEEMIVTTGKGERANITLPDGTSVALNYSSRLAYTPKVYNKKQRQIDFEGEGYFSVHKDADRPFVIDAKGLKVMVLGTVFNLKVRQNDREAELDLEQGKVQFSSTKTNENVILVAGNKAILDQSTGNITVVKNQEIENVPAWKRGMLTFREKTLIDVVTTLGTNYNVDIQIKGAVPLDDSFTGNLPVSDLDEALLILQTSYHLKCVKKEKNIVLYRN